MTTVLVYWGEGTESPLMLLWLDFFFCVYESHFLTLLHCLLNSFTLAPDEFSSLENQKAAEFFKRRFSAFSKKRMDYHP
jgi:hypothetical protein